jgi:hypothetical protein
MQWRSESGQEQGGTAMSAPDLRRTPHFSLPDFASVSRLPKPIKALVYLMTLAVLTVAAVSALAATVVIIGQLTGAFQLPFLAGR